MDIAPYLQIEEQVRGLIQRGHLPPGTLLPTVRQLAGDLNVAPNTVAR
ncbi:MAG TPA: GntR family transcriptional regulator, partial [Candidatus Baltobacteraceae bacterium]|nr:GntR family transcriptional regulator [Candidatus Baltobacteraceae bacterium]